MANANYLAKRAVQGALAGLIDAAYDDAPIVGLTHNFYRYPARFSPQLVRAAIEAFTDPGDLVLDPFVGGGTTLVEAMVAGRDAIGADISSLATFVSEVKTTVYAEWELGQLTKWAEGVARLDLQVPLTGKVEDTQYTRHLEGVRTWRLKRALDRVLFSARRLESPRLEAFARCVVLRTAQWALNGRKRLPSPNDFREMLCADAVAMIEGARELRYVIAGHKASRIVCLNRPTHGLETDRVFVGRKARKPQLVLTSPPYPGVHILYHRWQVDGRKETPAPFWIANRLDGDGAAYYTMGSRTATLDTYFNNLRASLKSVTAVCNNETVLVQVVAFAEPEWQLPRYLSVADDVGLAECFVPNLKGQPDGRLWRTVPNRKWYADQMGNTNSSQEVVLFHRRRA